MLNFTKAALHAGTGCCFYQHRSNNNHAPGRFPGGLEANLCDHRLLECLAQLRLEAKLQVCLGSPAAARLGCAVAAAIAGAVVGPPLVLAVICERRKRSGISKTDRVMVAKRIAPLLKELESAAKQRATQISATAETRAAPAVWRSSSQACSRQESAGGHVVGAGGHVQAPGTCDDQLEALIPVLLGRASWCGAGARQAHHGRGSRGGPHRTESPSGRPGPTDLPTHARESARVP